MPTASQAPLSQQWTRRSSAELCRWPTIRCIVPKTINKPIREKEVEITDIRHIPKSDLPNVIIEMEAEMREAAERLEFERAIQLRDTIKRLEKEMMAP